MDLLPSNCAIDHLYHDRMIKFMTHIFPHLFSTLRRPGASPSHGLLRKEGGHAICPVFLLAMPEDRNAMARACSITPGR